MYKQSVLDKNVKFGSQQNKYEAGTSVSNRISTRKQMKSLK